MHIKSMIKKLKKTLSRVTTRLAPVTVVCFLLVQPGDAATVPGFSKNVDINVREQEISEFLNVLFRDIGVPVTVSEDVEGTVNGRFNGTAEKIFDDVANAFNVTVYFDGAVAYVYPSNQLSQRVLPMSSGKSRQLVELVSSMTLPDERNRLNRIDVGIVAVGTPRFLEQVDELEAVVSKQQRRARPAKPKTPPRNVNAGRKLIDTQSKDAKKAMSYRVDMV